MEADPFVRQRALDGIGAAGQVALGEARVAIVGMGGLGCPAALYLATAGVGSLTIIDSDSVTVTNLHRQVLYGPEDVGSRKVDVAASSLRRVAPWSVVRTVDERLTEANAADELGGHDVVVDATDTFVSRRVVAAAASQAGIPLVWGAVNGWDGQLTVFDSTVGLDDLFPRDPGPLVDTCEPGAALGPLCGQLGAAMALEVIKLVTKAGTPLVGTLAVLDGRTGRWREASVRRSLAADA